MKTVRFTVPGQPRGKGRPRFTRSGHAYTDNKTKEYESRIAWCYLEQAGDYTFLDDSPLRVSVTAIMQIPKSTTKKKQVAMLNGEIAPKTKPDVDNILKIVLDGLQGVAFKDDKNVTESQIIKIYGSQPKIEVSIQEALL